MSATPIHATVLFAHGARDARWSTTLADLATRVRMRQPATLVLTAFLEFQPPTLEEALGKAAAAGCKRVDIVPVFWASGGHVANDLPPLLARMRKANPDVQLNLLPVLSELPGLLDFVAEAIVQHRAA